MCEHITDTEIIFFKNFSRGGLGGGGAPAPPPPPPVICKA